MPTSNRFFTYIRQQLRAEDGNILVLTACSMTFPCGLMAIGLDAGHVMSMQRQLQTLADTAVCRAMYAYRIVTFGAQHATRYASVRGASWNSSCTTSAPPSFAMSFGCTATASDVQNYVKSLGGFNSSKVTVATTWPGTTPDCASNCSTCVTANNKGWV